MKQLISAYAFVVAVMVASSAWAGKDRGGGGGWEKNGKVELLDLWEATDTDLLKPGGIKIPPDMNVETALKRFNALKTRLPVEAVYRAIRVPYDKATETGFWRPLMPGVELPFPDDAYPEYLRKDWKPVGIGRYDDAKNMLSVDTKFLAGMEQLHQDAFFVHEALYKILRRRTKQEDSRQTRRVIGYIFSDIPVEEIPDLFPSNIKVVGEHRRDQELTYGTVTIDIDSKLPNRIGWDVRIVNPEVCPSDNKRTFVVFDQKRGEIRAQNPFPTEGFQEDFRTLDLVKKTGANNLNVWVESPAICDYSVVLYNQYGHEVAAYPLKYWGKGFSEKEKQKLIVYKSIQFRFNVR